MKPKMCTLMQLLQLYIDLVLGKCCKATKLKNQIQLYVLCATKIFNVPKKLNVSHSSVNI